MTKRGRSGKRGLLIKTIELVFAAVLFLAFVGLLVKLILPGIVGEKNPILDDLDRYQAEFTRLSNGDLIPVSTPVMNYTTVFYSPSQAKPATSECGSGACACAYKDITQAARRQPISCKALAGIHDRCSGTDRCLAQPTIIITKDVRAQPETVYFCQHDYRITITKNRAEC